MAVKLRRTDLVYFSVPKVGCSSLKRAILRHNDPGLYEAVMAGTDPAAPKDVHRVYRSRPFRPWQALLRPPGQRWFCLVRDPVERFVSGYRNRILHHRDLAQVPSARLAWAALDPEPEPEEFALNLHRYAAASSSVHHHFAPLSRYLGRRPDRYDRVFTLAQIGQIEDYCADAGAPLRIPHEQSDGPRLRAGDLSARACRALRAYYAEDYAIWSDFFRS